MLTDEAFFEAVDTGKEIIHSVWGSSGFYQPMQPSHPSSRMRIEIRKWFKYRKKLLRKFGARKLKKLDKERYGEKNVNGR